MGGGSVKTAPMLVSHVTSRSTLRVNISSLRTMPALTVAKCCVADTLITTICTSYIRGLDVIDSFCNYSN